MTGAPADLKKYSTHFDELSTEEHELVFDINAVYPLSELRDDNENFADTASEYHGTTAANTDDTAVLETEQHGEYTAGFMCQAGIGARVPNTPTGDSDIRWGYYEADDNGDPLNGFYFGADNQGVYVARARGGVEEKVYQDEWNRDKLGEGNLNPSEATLDLADGLVFRIDFTYYGYGPVEMRVLLDDKDDDQDGTAVLQTVHVFHVDNETSIENTNLPIRAEIDSEGTSNDALDLFIGGRQFSVVGKRTNNGRTCWHYLDTIQSVDDSKWYHAISFKLKDGSDIGSIDFRKVLGEVLRFHVSVGSSAFKWQIRRNTVPDNPVWEVPESHEDKPDETAFKVDTNSADIEDGAGNNTGVNIDGGVLYSGTPARREFQTADISTEVEGDQVVSLLFKAVPSGSASLNDIFFKLGERW